MSPLRTISALLGLLAVFAVGQAPSPQPGATPPTLRLWVEDKQVKSTHGSIPSSDLMKELNTRCVGVVLTDIEEKADYRLEAGYAWCCTPRGESRGYKFSLFNKDGDAISSTKTHTLGNAVKDICAAIGRAKGKR
jgi:hypothetical protein